LDKVKSEILPQLNEKQPSIEFKNQNSKEHDIFLSQVTSSINQDKNKMEMNLKKINELDVINKKQQDEINVIVEKNIKIWQAEKVTVIHNIDQEMLTNLTYKNGFEEEWKYDMLKTLLCNILKKN